MKQIYTTYNLKQVSYFLSIEQININLILKNKKLKTKKNEGILRIMVML